MKYLAIIYLFLCFASGFTAFLVFTALYIKFKLLELKRYIYFLFSITILIFTIIFNFYYKSIFNFPRTLLYDYFFFIALLCGVSFYVFSLPHLIYAVIQKSFIKKKYLFALSLSPFALFLTLFILNLLFKIKINDLKISIYYATVLLILIIIHIFLFIIYHLKTIENPIRKKISKIILIFLLCYSPFGAMDAFYDEFNFIFKHFPDGFSFSSPYYFLWNVFTLIFLAYFFITRTETSSNGIKDEIIKRFGITQREKEVADHIIKGFQNKEISDKIFVSDATVKKHIYNLFQKTNARNRVELINILSGK